MVDLQKSVFQSWDALQVYWSSSSYWWRRHLDKVADGLQGYRRPYFQDDSYSDMIRFFTRGTSKLKELLASLEIRIRETDFREVLVRLDFFLRSKVTHPNVICFGAGVLLGVVVGYLVAAATKKFDVNNRIRSLVCTSYAGLEGIALIDDFSTCTKCGKREVVIQVKAAGIDPIDIRIASGYGRFWRKFLSKNGKIGKKQFPFTLGRDFSGILVEIGSATTDLEVGDDVWGALPFWYQGSLAEIIVVPADWVTKKPQKLGHEAAAVVPFSGLLAWNAVIGRESLDSDVLKGKRVLVHGGSTPAGCLAVQLAKICGADVTVTMPSHSVDLATRLEVDQVFVMDDASLPRLLGVVEEYDLVVNCYGDQYLPVCQKLCSKYGRVASCNPRNLKSDSFGFFRKILLKVFAKLLYCCHTPRFEPMPDKSILDQWAKLIDEGKAQPVIDRAFPFHSAEAALHFAARTNAVGKTVVVMRTRPRSRPDEVF